MSEPDIFISYSREDRAAAQLFAECLERERFAVWWDAALQSGETFDEVIEAELKSAKAVVVLWSPRSVASRWVRAEATLADRRNKLAPVIIEPCDRPLIFELTHTTDLSRWNGEASDPRWRRFVQDLQRLVGKRTSENVVSASSDSVPRGDAYARRDFHHRPFEPQDSFAHVHDAKPASDAAGDETQFYTRAADFDLLTSQFHCLEISEGAESGKRYVINPLGLRIGRSAPADVILSDSRVSRLHCLVELADDRLRVSDFNSTNGTFIDGTRIDGSDLLEVGSILKVGNVTFMHTMQSRAHA